MAQASVVRPYRWLAQYYDEIFAPGRAPIDAAREHTLGSVLPHVKTACDIACGTGTTALMLARKGIRIYAVDLSPSMCLLARKKAVRAHLPVRVLRADIRTFELPEPVDLVTCELDALNHIPRKADLAKVAGAVSRALRPGGHFYFDVNNSLGFQRYWSRTVWIETPHVAVVMRNGHNQGANKAWSEIDWFIRNGRYWQRRHERVEEVCWSSTEIRRALRQAGFDRVRAWDEAPFFKNNPVIGPGCRTVYLARKSRS